MLEDSLYVVSIETSFLEFPGFGSSILITLAGCNNNCIGCQNKQLQDYNQGEEITYLQLIDLVEAYDSGSKKHDNIVFIGGDPLFEKNRAGIIGFCNKYSKKPICIYTGYPKSIIDFIWPNPPDGLIFKCGKYIDDEKHKDIGKKVCENGAILTLASPNQNFYKIKSGEFKLISKNGIITLDAEKL